MKLSVVNGVVESNIPVLDCVITPPRPAEFAYAGSCKGAQRATEVDVWMLHALDSPLDATIVASQQVLVQGSNAGDHIDVTLLQKGRTGRTAHRGPSATIYAGNGDNDITLAGSNGYIVGGDGNDTITLKPATLGAAVFPGKVRTSCTRRTATGTS